MNNVVFTDFNVPENWAFINTLNKEDRDWIVENKVNNEKTDTLLKKIKRYLLFIIFPLSRFLRRKKYSKIIAWQQFYGLMFAFYCNLFKVKKVNKLVIMTFIYTEKNGFLGKLKFKFTNFSISNKYVDKIICFSRNEVDYYSKLFDKAKDKFIFINLGVDILDEKIKSTKGDYFVTSGKSNRDYNFLIDSFCHLDEKLKIISYTVPEIKSDNIEILRNVFDKSYYKYIANSFAVIVSLDDPNISSGQLVLIHAMQLGKPIICTRTNTINDYIEDGKNGYIIDKKLDELDNAIKKLKDDEIYNKMSLNSYEKYKNNFSIELMAKNIIDIL